MWNKVKNTADLDEYINTTMDRVISDGHQIQSIQCYQMSTEIRYEYPLLISSLMPQATERWLFCRIRIFGLDGKKNEFREKDAPDKPDGETMGNTIYFCARDTGHPVKFVKPAWADTYEQSDFKHRYIMAILLFITMRMIKRQS